MIMLLGSRGYMGSAFSDELEKRKIEFQPISRKKINYESFSVLRELLCKMKPALVIHAAGFTGKPNVDECEKQREETIQGNISLAQTVAQACDVAGVKLGFVSSGCIYTGVKVVGKDDSMGVEDRLITPSVAELLKKRSDQIRGFTEEDEPNFTFRHNNCSFYSGTKAIAERLVAEFPDAYIWRLRIPFDEQDSARNYLSKLQRYKKLYDNWNSISHRKDYVAACLDSWAKEIPGGIYNITNPGFISTREVAAMIEKKLQPRWSPEFWEDDDEFYRFGAITPRSNCILDPQKIIDAGIRIRPVEEAIEDSLNRWKKE